MYFWKCFHLFSHLKDLDWLLPWQNQFALKTTADLKPASQNQMCAERKVIVQWETEPVLHGVKYT